MIHHYVCKLRKYLLHGLFDFQLVGWVFFIGVFVYLLFFVWLFVVVFVVGFWGLGVFLGGWSLFVFFVCLFWGFGGVVGGGGCLLSLFFFVIREYIPVAGWGSPSYRNPPFLSL